MKEVEHSSTNSPSSFFYAKYKPPRSLPHKTASSLYVTTLGPMPSFVVTSMEGLPNVAIVQVKRNKNRLKEEIKRLQAITIEIERVVFAFPLGGIFSLKI
ncbi:hypothetical protein CR513_27576, partial [Mucuna pruriens]